MLEPKIPEPTVTEIKLEHYANVVEEETIDVGDWDEETILIYKSALMSGHLYEDPDKSKILDEWNVDETQLKDFIESEDFNDIYAEIFFEGGTKLYVTDNNLEYLQLKESDKTEEGVVSEIHRVSEESRKEEAIRQFKKQHETDYYFSIAKKLYGSPE